MSLKTDDNNTLPLNILVSWGVHLFFKHNKTKNKAQHEHLLVELPLPLQYTPVELSLWDPHPDPLVSQKVTKMKITHNSGQIASCANQQVLTVIKIHILTT